MGLDHEGEELGIEKRLKIINRIRKMRRSHKNDKFIKLKSTSRHNENEIINDMNPNNDMSKLFFFEEKQNLSAIKVNLNDCQSDCSLINEFDKKLINIKLKNKTSLVF